MKKLKKIRDEDNITKQIELFSLTGSHLLSETKVGDDIGLNELREQIILSTGNPPHFDTFERMIRICKIVKEVFPDMQFIENKKNKKISRIRIIEKQDITFKKEIRDNSVNLYNKIDSIESKIQDLTNLIKNK